MHHEEVLNEETRLSVNNLVQVEKNNNKPSPSKYVSRPYGSTQR